MRVHKMEPDELKEVLEFKNAAELMLERGKFSTNESFNEWQDLDDDDPDKLEILRIQKRLCKEEDADARHLDGRILAYEYLKTKYSGRLWLAIITADTLIANCCDPTKSYLDWYPECEQLHVMPEQ